MNYAILCLLLLSSLPTSAMSTESLGPEREDVDDDIPAPNEPTEDVVNNGTLDTGTSTPENVVNVRAKRHDDQQTPDVDENSGNNIDPPPDSSSSEDHTTSTISICTDVGTWTGWKLLAIVFIGLCILFLCSTIVLAFMHFGRRGK